MGRAIFVITLWMVGIAHLLSAASVAEVSPIFGPKAGGNSVVIKGTGFTGATVVKFGDQNATSYVVDSDTQITAVAPPAGPGTVDITVTAPSGASIPTSADLYTYQGSWIAYVSAGQLSRESSVVIPIDTATDVAGTPIVVSEEPMSNNVSALNFSPDGQKVYIVDAPFFRLFTLNVGVNTLEAPIVYPDDLLVASLIGSLALLPNGSKAYVGGGGDAVYPIDLVTKTAELPILFPITDLFVQDVAVEPNASNLYISFSPTVNRLTQINLTTAVRTDFSMNGAPPYRLNGMTFLPDGSTLYIANGVASKVSLFNPPSTVSPTDVTTTGLVFYDAASPNGEAVYISNSSLAQAGRIDTATNTLTTVAAPALTLRLAVTPDGGKVYYTDGASSNAVYPLDTDSFSFLPTITTDANWPFLNGVAVSPDQAPRAIFTVSNATSSTLTVFDATESLSPTGTIATYEWDFGDGSPLVTTPEPIVVHTYSTPGTYPVTLRVTNTAGTSTTQVFTGHQILRNGGPLAEQTQNLEVGFPPPSEFEGVVVENEYLDVSEYILQATWEPSPSPDVSYYRIYKKNTLVAVVPAAGPLVFVTHLWCEKAASRFSISAVSNLGVESERINIEVACEDD